MAAASLSVEVEEIDRNKIPVLTRNLDVLAVAPVVPMKLIEPVDVQVAASESPSRLWLGESRQSVQILRPLMAPA